ncbi:MAG: hypothetical protein ACXVI9_08530 [Mucilaginibacter sp.]
MVSSCQKGPYPYITPEEVKKIDSVAHPAIKNVAFIYKNNIYYVADMTKTATQITTNGSAARFVKMSHDHTKFAYENAAGTIIVVDNKGAVIATLSQYTKVSSFDWSKDDKTLYILNNSTLVYYGPAMNLPSITYPGISGNGNATCASVSPNGDLAYVIHWFDFSYGDEYKLVIKPANNGPVTTYSNPENTGLVMDYVNFTSNTTDFVVGYGSPTGRQSMVEFFSGVNNFPKLTYGGSTTSTPIYNSTLNYLVGGSFNSGANTIAPAALYLGDPSEFQDANIPTTIVMKQYSATGSNLYTDWK